MEILEINRNTLANLYEQFPDSFNGLGMSDKYLTYQGEKVDISEFNINDLLSGDSAFTSSLSGLSAQDVFKIIRLHATFLSSKKKDSPEEKVEEIKRENPLLQNISIVKKVDGVITREYFNIVDSMGEDHLFVNDRNVDIFSIYEDLKIRNKGIVSPDELIDAINRRLYRVDLEQSRELRDSNEVSEDFSNKMSSLDKPYQGDKSVRVYGNEENDIAIVRDDRNAADHKVVTFDKNENGDLVTEKHGQNVTEDGQEEQIDEQTKKDNNIEDEVTQRLISEGEFYRLLNSDVDLSEEEKKSVNLFYGYLGDLVIYEDYLLPELRDILNRFRAYVYGLQYEHDEEETINSKQQEAINKANEFELSKNQEELTKDPTKVKDEVMKLTLKYNNMNPENKGVISTLLVLSVIVIVSIILMIITFSLI